MTRRNTVSRHYSKKQRRRDDRIVLFIYGLIIVAFLSIIFVAWWTVFRTTLYYNVPYSVISPAFYEDLMPLQPEIFRPINNPESAGYRQYVI